MTVCAAYIVLSQCDIFKCVIQESRVKTINYNEQNHLYLDMSILICILY